MNDSVMQEMVQQLFSSLEALETQSAAILQFLKDKGLADEQELAPYLEQAGNASSVRWRAARVRIDYLISSAAEAAERNKKESPEPKADSQDFSSANGQKTATSQGEKQGRDKQQVARPQVEGSNTGPSADKKQNQPGKENQNEGTNQNARENAA